MWRRPTRRTPSTAPGRVDGEREVDLGASALAQDDDVGAQVAERVERLLEWRLGRDAGDEDHAGTGSRADRAAWRASTTALAAGSQVRPRAWRSANAQAAPSTAKSRPSRPPPCRAARVRLPGDHRLAAPRRPTASRPRRPRRAASACRATSSAPPDRYPTPTRPACPAATIHSAGRHQAPHSPRGSARPTTTPGQRVQQADEDGVQLLQHVVPVGSRESPPDARDGSRATRLRVPRRSGPSTVPSASRTSVTTPVPTVAYADARRVDQLLDGDHPERQLRGPGAGPRPRGRSASSGPQSTAYSTVS